jgi:pyruvate, water dikinase
MGWLQKRVNKQDVADNSLEELKNRFNLFRTLLDTNNTILQIIGDMEEKAQGEFLFDYAYIRENLDQLNSSIHEIVDLMIALGGEKYSSLKACVASIDNKLACFLPGGRPVTAGEFTISYDKIKRIHNTIVGSKNAQLGEIQKLGIRVPQGFAVTAWSYCYFIESNSLQERISKTLSDLNISDHEDLVKASEKTQGMILECKIPDDLKDDILKTFQSEIIEKCDSENYALRSSAIGEDTLYSFAGQYLSFLNLSPDDLFDKYLEILAGKFTPRAIYYHLSHSLEESDMPMSVGCTEMIDAEASGVIYTRNPVDSDDNTISIHSIYGLGSFIVEGIITPDTFNISPENEEIISKDIGYKSHQLILNKPHGTIKVEVDQELQNAQSIDDETIVKLAKIATNIEKHYETPQDIEWAIDRKNGEIVIIQTRPLTTLHHQSDVELPDTSSYEVLASGGSTVCPGAGCGTVKIVRSSNDISTVKNRDIVITTHPLPSLVEVLDKASALVTELGNSASHLAALAREKRVPMLAGIKNATTIHKDRDLVTVDATGGTIFSGRHDDFVKARIPYTNLFDDTAIISLLRTIISVVAPLNLVNPSDPDFRPEKCMTIHDITRFAHQRGIEEIFLHAKDAGHKKRTGDLLKSKIPIPVHILDIDRSRSNANGYNDNTIPSIPMKAFWEGMLQVGWPKHMGETDKFVAINAKHGGNQRQSQFTENSFAVIHNEYTLLSLRLGFHFTSVEALVSEDPSKNFIKVHYKGGGAAGDRRRRRIKLLKEIFSRMGMSYTVKSDFINSETNNQGKDESLNILRKLGQLTMMTKQLDMALSNDRVAHWYTEDFAKRLDLVYNADFKL